MSTSITYRVGDTYVIPFHYLEARDIHVYEDTKEIYDWTIVDNNIIHIERPLAEGYVEIRRITGFRKYFFGGSILLAEDLNTLVKYHKYSIEELIDLTANVLHYSADGSLDMKGQPIHNIGDPQAPRDAVSFQWVKDNLDDNLRKYISDKWKEIVGIEASLKVYQKTIVKLEDSVTDKSDEIIKKKPLFDRYVINIRDYLKDATALYRKLRKLILDLNLLKPVYDNTSQLNALTKTLPKLQKEYKDISDIEVKLKALDTHITQEATKVADLKAQISKLVVPQLNRARELTLENHIKTHTVTLRAPNTQHKDYVLRMPEDTPSGDNSVLTCDTQGNLGWQRLTKEYVELRTPTGKLVRIYPDSSIKTDMMFTLDATGKLTLKASNADQKVTQWNFETVEDNLKTHILKNAKPLVQGLVVASLPNVFGLKVLKSIPVDFTGTINLDTQAIFILEGTPFLWDKVYDITLKAQPAPITIPSTFDPTKGNMLPNVWLRGNQLLQNKYFWFDKAKTDLRINTAGFFEQYEQ